MKAAKKAWMEAWSLVWDAMVADAQIATGDTVMKVKVANAAIKAVEDAEVALKEIFT